MERRLSAILAADIVGYSAQMERDEADAFYRMTERRRGIFEPEFTRHQSPTDPLSRRPAKGGAARDGPASVKFTPSELFRFQSANSA